MPEEIEPSTSEEKGWLGKIKDSIYQNWQTILVALIVLIVGISAYNYNSKNAAQPNDDTKQEESAQKTDDANSQTASTENKEEYVEEKDQESAQQTQDQQAATDTKADDNSAQQNQETKTPETNTNTVESSGDAYKVIAEKGEGITHLARKAIEKYLSENNDSELTAAHRIYIEDYVQNRIGNEKIEIGHEETISKKTIEEAVSASKKLSPKSLDNLKKYTAK